MVNIIDGTNELASRELSLPSVGVVALANALLDISTTIKDDTLVTIFFITYSFKFKVLRFMFH